MKKRILLFTAIAVLVVGICGCNKADDTLTSEPTAAKTEAKSDDYMVKHIRSIEPENREEFLYYWQGAISYCKAVKLELKEIGNTNSYEFDPTDESQIPSELSGVDFSNLKRDNSKNLHKDFKLKIDGTDVELSFDGIDIYPTDYGYSDIAEIIESLGTE